MEKKENIDFNGVCSCEYVRAAEGEDSSSEEREEIERAVGEDAIPEKEDLSGVEEARESVINPAEDNFQWLQANLYAVGIGGGLG